MAIAQGNQGGNEKLAGQLGKGGKPKSPLAEFEAEVTGWWSGNSRRMVTLCGSEDMARKLLVTTLNVVQKTPKLIECEFSTFISALLQSAELDLFPGAKQECAYVPKEIKGRWEVQFWPMYQGHIKHMYRSGNIDSISCHIVRELDEFDFQEGSKPFVHFKRFIADKDEDRGPEKIGFCAIDHKDGGRVIELVSLGLIDKIMKSSPGYNSDYSPWKKWPLPMQRKTCLKQGQKWTSKSDTLARIIELDNAAESPQNHKHDQISLAGLASAVANPRPAALPDSTGIEMPQMPQREPEEVVVQNHSEKPREVSR